MVPFHRWEDRGREAGRDSLGVPEWYNQDSSKGLNQEPGCPFSTPRPELLTETSGNIHWHCSTFIPHRQLTVRLDGQWGKVILESSWELPLRRQAPMATPVLVMQGPPPLVCHLLQNQPYHFLSLSPSLGSIHAGPLHHAQGEMAPGVMEVHICLTPGSCTLPFPLLLPACVSATHACWCDPKNCSSPLSLLHPCCLAQVQTTAGSTQTPTRAPHNPTLGPGGK